MRKTLLFLFVAVLSVLSSCKKDKFDSGEQAVKEDQLIKDFITKNNLTGAVKHSSGLYYIISAPGSGNVTYTANTSVTAKYTGKFLNGTVFDNGNGQAITFALGGVIVGWQIGVPLIQKGGKIRLLIPSALAYGHSGQGAIPGDSVLDFDIELVNVQ